MFLVLVASSMLFGAYTYQKKITEVRKQTESKKEK